MKSPGICVLDLALERLNDNDFLTLLQCLLYPKHQETVRYKPGSNLNCRPLHAFLPFHLGTASITTHATAHGRSSDIVKCSRAEWFEGNICSRRVREWPFSIRPGIPEG